MKAAIHPDRGGEPTPVLALPPARERAHTGTIRRLIDLRVMVERELAAGPWDSWDDRVLRLWLETVNVELSAALLDLEFQIPLVPVPPHYEIVEREA